MDLLEHLLTSTQSSPSVSPEILDMLGKRAAAMFLEQKVPLNDGIKQLVSQNGGLNNEHIRRIVEFANNNVFQQLFQNSVDKNIHFPVADPGVIIREVQDGSAPAHSGKTLNGSSDYLAPPSKGSGLEDSAQLSDLFPVPDAGRSAPVEMAKQASALLQSAHANPVDDIYDLQVRLQAAEGHLKEAHSRLKEDLDDAKDEFVSSVRKEILDPDGAGVGGVVGALSKIAAAEEYKPIVAEVIQQLADEGVSEDYLRASFQKTAGAVVNSESALVRSWSGLEKIAVELVRTDLAIEEINRGLTKTAEALRAAR